MRKLPVFFLVDLSESMIGEPIDLVYKGMERLLRSLKKNPYALETVWIEVIGFAGKGKILEPYEELPLYYPPDFPIGGGTSLGAGLDLLMQEIDCHVKRSTYQSKGDWKPLVFLFTDGQPTDDYKISLSKWQEFYKNRCHTLVATLGKSVSNELLSPLADQAILLDGEQDKCFESYFKWLTDSIINSSIQVSEGIEPKTNVDNIGQGLSKIDLSKHDHEDAIIDDNYTVILGACQKTEEKYLIKYKRGVEILDGDVDSFDKVYRLNGVHRLDYDSYKALSGSASKSSLDTKYLRGLPSCPYCYSAHAFAMCQCGGVFCVDTDTEEQKCAWCGTIAVYGVSEESFKVDRRQG
ncbi:hypothetical protein K5X82_08140 [Halosquirtibacter xylanolyticus]|uniref:TerY-C metal binding domain-containing protein n=1 Tax=Halosquirtibacter xylanolyticus TaxID=3374599 RepID=UPI00374A34FE|nr:hypothetical protein K5X82_08140 [Prolixibacteraceae bacterium]